MRSRATVETKRRNVYVYETSNGKFPFDDWLAQLRDPRSRAKVQVRIDRLEEGNFGDFKPVGEGVLELRIDFGPGYRVYCAKFDTSIVLLLCGGDKSTQTKNIKTAISYWQEYKKQNGRN